METLNLSDRCEVYFSDNVGKIIVIIESGDADDTVEKFKEVQNMPHVLSASIMYPYSGEIEDDMLDNAEIELFLMLAR